MTDTKAIDKPEKSATEQAEQNKAEIDQYPDVPTAGKLESFDVDIAEKTPKVSKQMRNYVILIILLTVLTFVFLSID